MRIIAHRGASADAPENTLQSIALAIDHGADAIEIDVFQCRDEFVLIHDRWLHRTTDGYGLVQTFYYQDLLKFNAGNHQHIPTLAQALTCINAQCELNIEVKGVSDARLLLDYVSQHAHPDQQLIYSSFDHPLLAAITAISPDTRIGALTASKPIDYAAYGQRLGAYSVNLDMSFTDEHFIKDAKQRGLKVFVYTVDEPEDLRQLHRWQVDGVFTNHPAHTRGIIEALDEEASQIKSD